MSGSHGNYTHSVNFSTRMSTNPITGADDMVLLTNCELQSRVKELAQQINFDYRDKGEIVVIGVLKGAFMFFSDLVKHLTIDIVVDFIQVESYEGTESTGNVELRHQPTVNIRGKHVLLVEDILDTGITLSNVFVFLSLHDPASVRVVVLLDKPARRQAQVKADYTGFKIENRFVYGYGLDYKQRFRHLSEVRTIK